MSDWNHVEKRAAQKDGATLVPNSGRNYQKGDAIYNQYLIDYKFTEGKSFALSLEKIRKHEMDAFRTNHIGIFVVEFMGHPFEAKYGICDWSYMKDLI